jgi:signal transduction histidine kinase
VQRAAAARTLPRVNGHEATISLDAMLRAWPEAMLLAGASGDVVAMNPAAQRLLRIVPNGSPLRHADLLGPAASSALLESGERGEAQSGDETAPVGRPVLRAASSRLPDGGFLVRLSDATEEHRLRRHLEHAERLASIGELLSSVAHELSNPLTTVLGYADLLLADDDAHIPRDELERIRAEAMRCRRIVGNLLDLSRAEALELRPLSIAQVIDKVIEFRAYAAQIAQIELVREVAGDLPPVSGDHHRLVQAVLNLVHNAEDAVRERGAAERRITLRARRRGNAALVEVEDGGPGVPEAVRPFIFEPFFTTKPRGRGTGLGLSLVRATAKAHGGDARYDPSPSGGARFTIELPSSNV